nr:hypothetical protein [Parvibaculum sedimenti]
MEAHPYDSMRGRVAVFLPGAMQRHQRVALIVGRETLALAEEQPEWARARHEKHIGCFGDLDQIRAQVAELRIWMRPQISIGEAVECARLHTRQIIRHKPGPQPFALIDHGVEIIRSRIECKPYRIAQARGDARLHLAIGAEELDRGARRWIFADIRFAADRDKEMAAIGLEEKLPRDMAAAFAQCAGPRHHDARIRLQCGRIEIDAPDRAAVSDIKRAIRIGDAGGFAKARRKNGLCFGEAVTIGVTQGDDLALEHLRDEHDSARRDCHFTRARKPFGKNTNLKSRRHLRKHLLRPLDMFERHMLCIGRSIRLGERLIGRWKIGKPHFEMRADKARIRSMRRRRNNKGGEESEPPQRRYRRW